MCVNNIKKNVGARPINKFFGKIQSSDDFEKIFVVDYLAQITQYTRKSLKSAMEIVKKAENTVSYK